MLFEPPLTKDTYELYKKVFSGKENTMIKALEDDEKYDIVWFLLMIALRTNLKLIVL